LSKKQNTVFVISGPTAVGKTDLCVYVAKQINAEIISADSRQFYKELSIGTAKPTKEEQKNIPHHFVDFISIEKEYNANDFEKDALKKIDEIFASGKNVIVTGGSGLYIDILCNGFDENIPDANPEIRKELNELFAKKGLSALQEKYQKLDPKGYSIIDSNNPKRLLRAIEISLITGKPASELKKGIRQKRPYNIIKIGLSRERDELYNRINLRVDKMMEQGLLEEAKNVLPYRNHNALKTVGYRELFAYFDGDFTLEEAVEKIKTNTRRYAKRQMTWFNKDKEIQWFHPKDEAQIISFVSQFL
tara:strand:+ start:16219 stop:17130 length:912 start_codon:yes stop_codon:yes gene_type:complete